MSLPRAIRINGRTYDIRRAPMAVLTEKVSEAFDIEGLCEHNTSTIWIAEELAEDRAMGTLEHEAGHGASEESGARHHILRNNLSREENLIRTWLPVYLDALRNGMVWT